MPHRRPALYGHKYGIGQLQGMIRCNKKVVARVVDGLLPMDDPEGRAAAPLPSARRYARPTVCTR